ncbi:uncharacterized protein FSUBG_12690 [Fusarium subglutinans]|uniref:F-box domain-containing protein n=1 Tax=Gibberella subglutinans TaxID=42677 RepID=A0A8H5L3I5_GIBSU|nr:uncharacterized protein FSUBG_12690 [Fusarium subglutinans]KAF5584727.1 hypothetical protein FSUBG_12690 [Fusarium subglutinans]
MASDIFNWLPPEIHINIVKHLDVQAKLDVLRDVQSFNSASPTARHYFYANQCASFLRPYIQEIYRIFGDETLVPLALILLHVRKIRAQTRGLTSLQIEQRLRPHLDAFARFENSEPEEEWKYDLGYILAIFNMNREMAIIWGEYCQFSRPGTRTKLSNAVNHFLRYDLYCQLGCNGEEKLFSENEHVKELESHIYKLLPQPPQARELGVNMPCLVKNRHKRILLDVRWQLGYGDARNEQQQVDDIMRQGGPPDFVMQRLRECRFKTKGAYDVKLYLDHVVLQGYPLLLHLQQLTRDARAAYVVDTFFRIVTEKFQIGSGMSRSTRSTTKAERIYRSLA